MKASQTWRRLLAADESLSRRSLVRQKALPSAYAAAAILAHAGDGVLVIAVGAVLYLFFRNEREYLAQAAACVFACAALVAVIKLIVRRERPCGKASARWSAMPKHDVHAFPSGHAARVACVAACSAIMWPSVTPWLVVWALLVGVARVLVGAHHWLDVLAGWVLGAVTSVGLLASFASLF